MDNNICIKPATKHSTNGFPAFCIVALLVSIAAGQVLNGPSELARSIRQRLDSIEVEKQVKKRNGRQFDDLEEKTAELRDSLSALKTRLLAATDHPEPASAKQADLLKKMFSGKFQPQKAFDWIIVIIGGVALLSALVMIIGLFRARRLRKKKRITTAENGPTPVTPEMPATAYPDPTGAALDNRHQTYAPPHPSPVHTLDNEEPVFPGRPDRVDWAGRPDGSGEDPAVVPKALTRTEIQDRAEPLSRLRRRVGDKALPANNNPSTTAAHEDQSQPPVKSNESAATVNEQVIAAARQGLDIQEISRRFHLGIDQVALILKVARIQTRR